MSQAETLGRKRGVFVPLDDVEPHLMTGWHVIDDLAGDPIGAECAFLAEPDAYRPPAIGRPTR